MKILSFDIGIKNLAYCYAETIDNDINIILWDVINLCEVNYCNYCNEPAVYYKHNTFYCKKHAKEQKYKLLKINTANLEKQKIPKLKTIATSQCITFPEKIKKCDLLNLIQMDISNNYLEQIKSKKTTDYDLVDIGINLKTNLDIIFEKYKKDIDLIIIENQIGPLAIRMKCLQCMVTQYFINNDVTNIKFISAINKLKGFSDISTNYNERKKLSIKYLNQIIDENKLLLKWKEMVKKHKKKDDLADCFLQYYWYLKNKLYCGNT